MLCHPKILEYLAGILLIVAFFCVSPAHAASNLINVTAQTSSGSSKEIQLYSGYHALVIGCSNYRQGWPSLPNAANDAKVVGQMLKDMGWEVNLVIDPDRRTVEESFAKLITGAGREPNRGILIWYSGHGYTLKEADGSKLGYIVPTNAPDPEEDEYGFITSAVSMRDIETVAKRIFSKHVLVVFDSCFSGAIFRMVRAKPSRYIKEKVAEPVRQFITAGNENEEVPDKSVFKDVFIKGIQDGYGDRNEDGYITGEELGAYLSEEVVNYSRGAQHPQYGKINNPALDRGDFVFVKRQVSELEKLKQEVARLTAENTRLRTKSGEDITRLKGELDRQDKLKAENERLQGELRALRLEQRTKTQVAKNEPKIEPRIEPEVELKPTYSKPQPGSKIKAVILPWQIRPGSFSPSRWSVANEIRNCVTAESDILIEYSYYDRGDESVFKDIQAKSFFDGKDLNVEKVVEFTKQMNADIVVVGTISGHRDPSAYGSDSLYSKLSNVRLSGFVFDIHDGQLYSLKYRDNWGRPSRLLPEIICNLIVDFEEEELEPIKY